MMCFLDNPISFPLAKSIGFVGIDLKNTLVLITISSLLTFNCLNTFPNVLFYIIKKI